MSSEQRIRYGSREFDVVTELAASTAIKDWPNGTQGGLVDGKNYRLHTRLGLAVETPPAPDDIVLWKITIGGGCGTFRFLGTESEAEEMRVHKARWEGAAARKVLAGAYPNLGWVGIAQAGATLGASAKKRLVDQVVAEERARITRSIDQGLRQGLWDQRDAGVIRDFIKDVVSSASGGEHG